MNGRYVQDGLEEEKPKYKQAGDVQGDVLLLKKNTRSH